jgi:hypothetical protein
MDLEEADQIILFAFFPDDFSGISNDRLCHGFQRDFPAALKGAPACLPS